MKINLANRFKNKATLVAVISILALLANQVAGVFGVDYSAQIEQLVTIAGTVLTLLAGLGIIVDPNTKGVKDSAIAMEYKEPRDDQDLNQAVGFVNDMPIENDDNVIEAEKEDNPKGEI